MISCFLLKPFGLARFGGTLKVPPHSAFGTKTFPFSSWSSSVSKANDNEKHNAKYVENVFWFESELFCGLLLFKSFLPSLLTNSDLELADNERKRAAEFGRYVSNEADNSISGFRMPYFKWKDQKNKSIKHCFSMKKSFSHFYLQVAQLFASEAKPWAK